MTHLFVMPSLASGLGVTIGAVVFMLLSNSSILQSDGFFTDLLLGKDTSTGLIATAERTTFALGELTLGNPTLNKILFFLFWMMIGLVVYTILSSFGMMLKNIRQTVDDVQHIKDRKEHLDQSRLIRITVRTASLFALLFTYLLLSKFIIPFATLASKAWLGNLSEPLGWFYAALAFVVLSLSLHILIVLVRLVTIRPRLFGGWDVFM